MHIRAKRVDDARVDCLKPLDNDAFTDRSVGQNKTSVDDPLYNISHVDD